MKLWMITASATEDGAPIYLQPNARWTRRFVDGHTFESVEERDALLEEARQQQRLVCDPYFMRVSVNAGRPVPSSLRERIRAEGPTVTLVGTDATRATAIGA